MSKAKKGTFAAKQKAAADTAASKTLVPLDSAPALPHRNKVKTRKQSRGK